MPNLLTMFKTERMNAIEKLMSKGEYDLYLFQELWRETDYNKIKSAMPSEYQITEFSHHASCLAPCISPAGR